CRIRHDPTKTVECALESGVVVIGDRLRLSRLLTNLVDNAERHAETMIIITVRRESRDEGGDQLFPHGVALLEVLDDGGGIDPAKREVVFQRFARLEASRSKDAGGTGLGLPIARQIAEAGGGTLRIEDSPRGARFVLRLPLAATRPMPHLPPRIPAHRASAEGGLLELCMPRGLPRDIVAEGVTTRHARTANRGMSSPVGMNPGRRTLQRLGPSLSDHVAQRTSKENMVPP
ncbi:ATP-binding protein, partial [Planotetraspora silvatica]|uniref:sensor histidine kinase n=1 Tax=Planotetraspora silvatica TaxID=234614 RepID=UPI0031E08E40